MTIRGTLGHYFLPFTVVLAYLFLYIPIAVVVIFSFNNNQYLFNWVSFTTQWYSALFEEVEVWEALRNSFIVATSSVLLSLTLGTLFIFYSTQNILSRLIIVFYANLAAPEIVLAAGLVSFFSFFSVPLGLTTLIAGHTLIGLGYVVPILYTRFIELSNQYIEASLDLGATRTQTLLRVILPLLAPALTAAGLLVFIISLDDFVLSFFCSGPSAPTLPIYIYALLRSGASPVVGALSAFLLLISSLMITLFSLIRVKKMDMMR